MVRVDLILSAVNPIQDPKNPVELKEMKEGIEDRGVSFRYSTENVVKHVDLSIKKGQTVALVGQSGSGKSTMADLLPRFYDVNEGGIYIDGINIKDFRVHDLRGLMGNVNQEAILFNDGASHRSGKNRQCARFHHGDRTRIRYLHWRSGKPSFGRAATTCEYSPCNPEKPSYSYSR